MPMIQSLMSTPDRLQQVMANLFWNALRHTRLVERSQLRVVAQVLPQS